MTGTLSVKDIIATYLSKYSLNKTGADQVIRFSTSDIFNHQPQIVALWRELNHRSLKPAARTFLGKIISIRLHS